MAKPKTARALIRQLAQQKKKKTEGYKQGSEEGKVWINFQATKKLKREFKELCDKKDIVASEFMRKAVELLVENNGDVSKTLNLKSNVREEI